VAAALGRVAASQPDELLLDVTLDLDLVGARGLRLVVQRGGEALGDQALADALDGAQADAERLDDVLVGLALARRSVGEQQDAGVGGLACRCFADGDRFPGVRVPPPSG